MNLVKAFIDWNRSVCKWFDQIFLPSYFIKDGNSDFIRNIAPTYLHEGMKVYDVGGGKQPFVNVDKKQASRLHVVGIDICHDELVRAPVGSYDEMVCADIARVKGRVDGDLVICQAVLEHVRDTENAIKSISSLLKQGGKALIFVPSRNAVFARLNIILPECVKRYLLYTIFPSARGAQGFPSYYHKCTPNELSDLANQNGMKVKYAYYYYMSTYFSFLFPIYILWRVWVVIFKIFFGVQASETFTLVLEKK
jgi:2-polyprenyl-3-methyl-5-hydroxy-6-metoxy-1,4-benzoquinol methylase